MDHKCWVFKDTSLKRWFTQCAASRCPLRRGYLSSETWEEAMLEALHHRMRNL